MKRVGIQQFVALVLSLLLWAFVRYKPDGGVGSQRLAQLKLNVPIQIKNNQPKLIPYEISSEVVSVTLQGEAAAVDGLRDGMVKAYVDLTGQDGPTVYAEVVVQPAGGLTTVNQDPRQVQIRLSPSAPPRSVPVRVTISGSPATGLSAGEIRLEPKTVRVAGPEALVNDVHEVVSRVVLDGQSQDYNLELRDLAPVNSQGTEIGAKIPGRGIKILPAVVSATIPILSDNRTVAVAVSLDQLRITPARGWAYRLEVEPEFVTLRLSRNQKPPKFLLTKPQSIAVSTKVDSRDIDLVIPNGVEVVGSSTVTLKVIPERQDLSESPIPPPTPELIDPTSTSTPAPSPSLSDKRDG